VTDEFKELVRCLDWAMSHVAEPRLIRGQNDGHYNRYQRSKACLELAKMMIENKK
jgi:hypothetical protein